MPNNDKEIEINLRSRFFSFPPVEELTELERMTVIGQLEDKMKEISVKINSADTGKIATYAAYEIAIEKLLLQKKHDSEKHSEKDIINGFIYSLEKLYSDKKDNEAGKDKK